MIIHQVLTSMENATNPVVQVFRQNEHFKVITLGFKKGVVLKDHQTGVKTVLLVIEGAVTYKEAERTVQLYKYDEFEIPLHITHSVHATEDSICLLIRG
jgi:quercetin dioxygenase-like cupin family protein